MKTYKEYKEYITEETTNPSAELAEELAGVFKQSFPKGWTNIKTSSLGNNPSAGLEFGILPKELLPNKIPANDPGIHHFFISYIGDDKFEIKFLRGGIYISPEEGSGLAMSKVKTKFRKISGSKEKVTKSFEKWMKKFKGLVKDNKSLIYGVDRYPKGTI